MNQECKVDATVEDMERALDEQTPHARSGPAQTSFKLALDLIASSPIDGSLRLAAREIGHGLFAVLQNPQMMMRLGAFAVRMR
jgi:hypothetical protein